MNVRVWWRGVLRRWRRPEPTATVASEGRYRGLQERDCFNTTRIGGPGL